MVTYLKLHIAGFAYLHGLNLVLTFAVFISWRRRWPQRYHVIEKVLDLVVLGTLMKRQVGKILVCCRESGTLAV